jgi:hypothetical protein
MLKTFAGLFVVAALGFSALPANAMMMMHHHKHWVCHWHHHHKVCHWVM